MGQARLLLCRLTTGLLVYSQCWYYIISSECFAQMGSEQAGDYSSSSRNKASTIEGKGDTMTQAHPGGPYPEGPQQMHRKSGGHKIHPENLEKRIEVAGLHNALPHLNKLASQKPVKNLQPAGSRRRRKLNDNNAGKRQQAKRRTKSRKSK